MDTIEILKQARDYIAKGFCRGAYARDGDGSSVFPYAPDAACWCLDGAVQAVLDNSERECFHEGRAAALKALLRVRRRHAADGDDAHTVQRISDASDQQSALEWIDAAIQEAA